MSSKATISVDVVVSAELPAQNIGTLSAQIRYVDERLRLCRKIEVKVPFKPL